MTLHRFLEWTTFSMMGLAFGFAGWTIARTHPVPLPVPTVASSALPQVPMPEIGRAWIEMPPPAHGPIVGLEGGWVYPCADPGEIEEHLTQLGCGPVRRAGALDEISSLGEDVCLKLWDARTRTEVRALGMRCP